MKFVSRNKNNKFLGLNITYNIKHNKMKQFFALVTLFSVLSVSAQQSQDKLYQTLQNKTEMKMERKHDYKKGTHKGNKKHQKLSVEERVNKFDQYGVTPVQKEKLRALYEKRQNQMKKDFDKQSKEIAKLKEERKAQKDSFNKDIEKILNKDQYAKFKDNQVKRFEGKKRMHKKYDLKKDSLINKAS